MLEAHSYDQSPLSSTDRETRKLPSGLLKAKFREVRIKGLIERLGKGMLSNTINDHRCFVITSLPPSVDIYACFRNLFGRVP